MLYKHMNFLHFNEACMSPTLSGRSALLHAKVCEILKYDGLNKCVHFFYHSGNSCGDNKRFLCCFCIPWTVHSRASEFQMLSVLNEEKFVEDLVLHY